MLSNIINLENYHILHTCGHVWALTNPFKLPRVFCFLKKIETILVLQNMWACMGPYKSHKIVFQKKTKRYWPLLYG
jgi:hypothetical protein